MAIPARRLISIVIAVIVIVAAVVVSYYFLALRPTPAPEVVPTAPPIKIALIPPLTGPAARTGKELQDAIYFTYEELKAAGKIPVEVDGELRDLEFIWLDSKSDPEEAVKAYEDAIVRLGADILGWNWHSSVAMALFKISTRYGKIHWADVGESQYICYEREKNPEESKYWFKCWACPPYYASLFPQALEDAMKAVGYEPRNKRVALLVEDTDYGLGMADALKEAFEELGWTVVSIDRFTLSPPETEFGPIIMKYKTYDVSLVYQVSTGLPSMVAFLKQAHEAGLRAFKASFGVGFFSVDEWYPVLKEASDYVLSMDSVMFVTEEQKAWAEKFKEKYGYMPSPVVSAYWAHDLLCMLVEALHRAKTLNPEVLRRTLLDMKYKGLMMTIDIAEEPIPGKAHYMEVVAGLEGFYFPLVQWIEGEPVVLWPQDIATGKLEIPPELT